VPITRYCDDHHLTPRQRLELLVPVCQAVQHAHQKGIIHRDLKPSNVLVAEYDDKPVAKVIDFGVAKATGPKLTDRTMYTEFGQVVGTVEYMSPEQAKLNALDIDTRSDIYALGVLLYELLTGTTPFEKKRLQAAAFDEVLRIIREESRPGRARGQRRVKEDDCRFKIAMNADLQSVKEIFLGTPGERPGRRAVGLPGRSLRYRHREATASPLTPDPFFFGPVFAPISHYRVRTARRYPRSDGCSVPFVISD
jgi:serine/threonine protein kinase